MQFDIKVESWKENQGAGFERCMASGITEGENSKQEDVVWWTMSKTSPASFLQKMSDTIPPDSFTGRTDSSRVVLHSDTIYVYESSLQ